MKRTDLGIIAGIALLGLIAAFWFLVLSPKRQEASDLGAKVSELETTVAAQENLAATAQEAKKSYDQNYHQLVVLGKAVPEDADTSSLLVELQRTADHDDVDFDSIALGEGSGDAAAAASQVAAPAPLTAPGESSSTEAATSGENGAAPAEGSTEPAATPTPTAATPTETTAATLPLGASVGPAGLPVMPYDLSFTGGFFQIADFFSSIDSLVHSSGDDVGVRGRLLTVNGFSLTPVDEAGGGSDPMLNADVSLTSYVTPAEQGAVAGSTPAAPAPTTPPPATTTPASSTTTTPSP
jgi:Tfp pilus assembly protein PilO